MLKNVNHYAIRQFILIFVNKLVPKRNIEIKYIMLVFNTTYTIPNADARNFVIWVHQVYIPKATESQLLTSPRLLRILSHKDEDTECFSLQFNVTSSSLLHKWYSTIGKSLSDEMLKMFEERIVGFSTIMEEIEG